MKKLMMVASVLGALCAVPCAAQAATIDVTQANIGQNRTLQSGNVYRFTGNVTYNAPATESALTVANGAIVTLVVPKNVTVTLKGGDASGTTGAGAGIEVPENATLYILGEGTLNANGGNAANGGNGRNGGNPSAWDPENDAKNLWSGHGGGGGYGGGGAGAGIGGKGGAGGGGGTDKYDVQGLSSRWDGSIGGGTKGTNGSKGSNGANGGTVFVAKGTMTVNATRGAAGAGGTGGAAGNSPAVAYVDRGPLYSYYAAFSGGGGGGGAGGGEACDVGGGGAGGNGGAGGGSGAIRKDLHWNDIIMIDGWGKGGKSPVSGGAGGKVNSDGEWTGETKTDSNGVGGESGELADSSASAGKPGALQDFTSSGKVGETSVLAGAGDGWTYDPTANTVSLTGNGQFAVSGAALDVGTWKKVTLTGLPKGVDSFAVSGLSGVGTLASDGQGNVTDLYLQPGDYAFAVGEGCFAFTVAGGNLTATAAYRVTFGFGAHVTGVTYTVNGGAAVEAGTGFTLSDVPNGTKIAFSVTCEDGYGYFNATELTVGTENETVNLTASRTADLEDVSYRGADGKVASVATVKSIYPGMDRTIGDGNWYAIEADTTVETLTVSGTVNLILVDGVTLTVEGGIRVEGDNALNIYAQSAGSGKLIANGSDGCAGIGGGCGEKGMSGGETMPGGTGMSGGSCGTVTIYGGVVTATGGTGGAGIGGGRGGVGGTGTTPDANNFPGCDVIPDCVADGGNGGVGGAGGTVTINGGTVTATGGGDGKIPRLDLGAGRGAGIGGGSGGDGGNGAPGVSYVGDNGDGGNGGAGGTVTINGGTVAATGGAGIGGGAGGCRSGRSRKITITSWDSNPGNQGAGADVTLGDGVEVVEGKIGNDGESVVIERTVYFEGVAYCGADGAAATADAVKRIRPRMDRTLGDGNWYAIDADTAVATLTVSGTANLILVDGVTLTVNGGIRVEGENALNIYAQSAGTGKLIAKGSGGCAGIGGGAGEKGAESASSDYSGIRPYDEGTPGGACGVVTIYGGVVTATSYGGGAGIGGGCGGGGGDGSWSFGDDESTSSSLNGGKGAAGGAGGTVTINGGTVTATGGGDGAGIGGGRGGNGGRGLGIGGSVGIGNGGDGGDGGAGGMVTVNGGTVTATGGWGCAGIGGGVGGNGPRNGNPGNQGAEADVTLGDGIGVVEGKIGNDSESVVIERTADLEGVAYCGADGTVAMADAVKRIYPRMDRTLGDGNWYAIEADTTVETLTVSGTVNLILVDGVTLTVEGGIRVEGENALNIYAQSAGSGKLIANGADGCAGIGGGAGVSSEGLDIIQKPEDGGSCGAVTIYGGVVTATGGNGGAGIGGGRGGAGSSYVRIDDYFDGGYGLDMTHPATKGMSGGAGGAVTIYGGIVAATGHNGGAGIGGGYGGVGGLGSASGIGSARDGGNGGAGGAGGTVTINGGVVTATGDSDGTRTVLSAEARRGAGIGGGSGGNGGYGVAGGGSYGNGGDGGDGGAGGTVTVNGGTVTATGGAGIGGGAGGFGGKKAGTESTDGNPGNPGADADVTLDDSVEVVEGKIGNDSESVVIERTVYLEGVAYCGADGTVATADAVRRIHPQMDRTIGDGNWYAIDADTAVATLTVSGTANLILVDGVTLTVEGGIRVEGENALNIYAQSAGTGKLIANGADGCAGIGGGAGTSSRELLVNPRLNSDDIVLKSEDGGSCGAVTIYGGVVTATGGNGGAGIGGGRGGTGASSAFIDGFAKEIEYYTTYPYNKGMSGGSCGAVTIYGGVVTATGHNGGAGIGGGCGGAGGEGGGDGVSYINGEGARETVYRYSANGGNGGVGGAGGTVTINGGTVTATGGGDFKLPRSVEVRTGAGIGGGRGGNGGNGIDLEEAIMVIGKGGDGGDGGAGGTVAVNGGTVTATVFIDGELEMTHSAGIGGGVGGFGGKKAGPESTDGNAGSQGAGADVTLDDSVEVVEGKIGNDGKSVKIAEKEKSDPLPVTVAVSVGEGVEKVIYGGQEYTADFSIPDVAPGTVLTFTMVTAGDQYDEAVTAEGDVTGGKVGNDYVYTVASEPSGQNAAIRFNTTVAPAVAYAYEDSKIIFVARCSTFAEAWEYASDGEHYVKIFKDYTGSESSELFALDGTMRVNFNGHTVYATAERGKGFAIETVNSRHRTYTPYDTIAEAYAMGGSQATYVVLGTADASTITLGPGNLGFFGNFWEGDGGIVGSIVNEPALKDAEKTERWSVSETNFEFVARTDKPTPLMPGQGSKAYETREEAEAAAAETEVLPAEGFGLTGDALVRWQGFFVNQIYLGGDGKFRIMPELNADGSNALAQAEAKLTKAIDVGAIAAATGAIEEMVLEGAEPGFYYTLFKSTDVTVVLEQESHDPLNSDRKALSDGKVTFKNVTKPSAAAGFLSVRAFVKESFTEPGLLGD